MSWELIQEVLRRLSVIHNDGVYFSVWTDNSWAIKDDYNEALHHGMGDSDMQALLEELSSE